MSEERCVYCWKVIPEGRQVCPECEAAINDYMSIKAAEIKAMKERNERILVLMLRSVTYGGEKGNNHQECAAGLSGGGKVQAADYEQAGKHARTSAGICAGMGGAADAVRDSAEPGAGIGKRACKAGCSGLEEREQGKAREPKHAKTGIDIEDPAPFAQALTDDPRRIIRALQFCADEHKPMCSICPYRISGDCESEMKTQAARAISIMKKRIEDLEGELKETREKSITMIRYKDKHIMELQHQLAVKKQQGKH